MMEMLDFVKRFSLLVTENNLKDDLKDTMMAIAVADRLSDSKKSEFNPDMLLTSTGDKIWDSVLKCASIQPKSQGIDIDRIKKKRLLCDTLTILGVDTSHKQLTIPSSKSLIKNCHIDAELITDEAEVDKVLHNFKLKEDIIRNQESYKYLKELAEIIDGREKFRVKDETLFVKKEDLDIFAKSFDSVDDSEEVNVALDSLYMLNEILLNNLKDTIESNELVGSMLIYRYLDVNKDSKPTVILTSNRYSGTSFSRVCNSIFTAVDRLTPENLFNSCKTLFAIIYGE